VSLYRLIDEESDRQPVSRLCRTLGVTRSGFYDWQRQPLSDRALADWLLTEQIRGVFDESEQTYGSPRVYKELKLGRGLAIGEKRVAASEMCIRLLAPSPPACPPWPIGWGAPSVHGSPLSSRVPHHTSAQMSPPLQAGTASGIA